MRKTIITLLALASIQCSASAITIAKWTFEVNTPSDLTDSATGPSVADESGNGNGTASGVHASSATDWTTPAGNGSVNSFNANNWAIGDFYQFQFSTIGFTGIGISFDATSSNTGPRDFGVYYSANGDPFAAIAGTEYSVLANAAPNTTWSSVTYNPDYNFVFDLSTTAALDNAASVEIRLVNLSTTSANGGTVAATGTSRVDNFTVTATEISAAVPDGGSSAILLALPLLGLWTLRRLSIRTV